MTIEVRPAKRDELQIIAAHLPQRPRATHEMRITGHELGNSTYFIAWRATTPVGHVLLRLKPEVVSARARGYGCPEIEDLFVSEKQRNAGVGRALMTAAEERRNGSSKIGLSAGVDDGYDAARYLYEERGYEETGTGEFWLPYEIPDDDGGVLTGKELCTYLVKRL